jgi:hypothetical protein
LDSDKAPIERDRRSVGLLLLTILASAAFSLFVVAQDFWVDDSFITFRYFRNLFEGAGLKYNAGDPVEGYTNFLWGVVAWSGMHLGHEPINFTQWVSVGAQAVTLLVVYRIGLLATGKPSRALLAPLLLAGQIGFLTYPMTGMETSFFSMLVTLAFYLFQTGEARTRAGSVALGFVLMALCMTRFDGFVLIGILAACPLLARRQWRGLLLPLGMFALAFVVYNAWRFSYYPTPLPNSFYAKISFSISRSLEGLDYVVQFFSDRQLTLLLALMPFAMRRSTAVGRYLGWVVFVQLAYVVTVGGDWMPHDRFILHVLPLLMLMTQQGAWQLWDAMAPKARAAGSVGVSLLLVLLVINAVPLYLGREFKELKGNHFRPPAARALGLALDRMLPEEMTVAIEWGGILPYYTHHDVLDTFGINDREIAQHEDLPRTKWGRFLGPYYLAGRAPDVIVPCAVAFNSKEEAIAAVQPGGESRYGYYMTMDGPEHGYSLKILRANNFAFYPLLVKRGRWIAADDVGSDPGQLSQAQRSGGVPYQLSLFWGGGEPANWLGQFALESDQGQLSSGWTWLTDHEENDSLIMGLGMAPADWALPKSAAPKGASGGVRWVAPTFGGLIRGKTNGEADGVCMSFTADPSTLLTVSLGATKVEWRLSELAEQPRTVAIDGFGNVVHAVAQRLDTRAALERDHHGARAHRASLHTHSRFSTNPTLHKSLFRGMAPFVGRAWWTDHNIGTRRVILGGDFEDQVVVDRYWEAHAEHAELLFAGSDAESRSGRGAYRLRARGEAGVDAGRAWIGVADSSAPSKSVTLIGSEPELRFSWKPSGNTIAFADVQFASGETIRYLSSRTGDFGPYRHIVLQSAADAWSDHVIDLAADYDALLNGRIEDSFVEVLLGVLCFPDESAEALFDGIELIAAEPSTLIQQQVETMAKSRFVRSHVGMEQSAWRNETGMGALVPHLTFLAPGDVSTLFPDVDRMLLPDERRAMVEEIQAAGGCVGTHHMQLNNHYEALIEGGGLGVDLFEIGGVWTKPPAYMNAAELRDRDAHRYPAKVIDEVYPLLVRWDRLTARGLFLTGYGAPDLNGSFDRPSQRSFNRWLTSILCEDDSEAGLLRALRSGRAVGSEWRTPALVTLDAGSGLSMGKLVVTDNERHSLRARVSEAPQGSRLSFVVGPLVRDRWDADVELGIAPVEVGDPVLLDEGESETVFEVDTTRACFVRAELRNPAGHLIAFGNPVCFLPYWPERWPFGRVAFDWQGVRLAGEDRLLLEAARVDTQGRLLLEGDVFGDTGELRLACDAQPKSVELGVGTSNWNDQLQQLVLTELPPGVFTVALTFAEPLDPGRTADPMALPDRKSVLAEIDVGDPASEATRQLSGWGPIVNLTGGGNGRRVLGIREAAFVLSLPVGETTWIAFDRAVLPPLDRAGLPDDGSDFLALDLLLDGTLIGSIGELESHVIEIPAMPSPTGTSEAERRFTLRASGIYPPMIDRILLYGGPGVVEF